MEPWSPLLFPTLAVLWPIATPAGTPLYIHRLYTLEKYQSDVLSAVMTNSFYSAKV